jgi:ribosomal protein L7/L12
MSVFWIGLVIIGMFIAGFIFVSQRSLIGARRSGLLPKVGQATMADVERLVRAGERILAIRCYREIHKCSLQDAKRAVDDLTPTN